MIYLDNAATTFPKPVGVERAMISALRTMASPGRGAHPLAMSAAQTVFDCREAAAELFNVPDEENVVFTFNATHALNIAISSLVRRGERVTVSGFEHNSVTRPLEHIGAKVDVAGSVLFDREETLADFKRLIPGSTAVVCTHVSNAFGYILPIYEIAALCRENSVPLIIDASQSAGIIELDFERLGAAFVAMPGHKALFGPQGTGILLCASSAEPIMYGGSGSDSLPQKMPDYFPDRLEAGTHNVCGIAGLRAGLQYVSERGTASIFEHEQKLLRQMLESLSHLERLEIFSGEEGSQSGVLSLRCRDMGAEELAERLAREGICVRSGLHCAPMAHQTAGTVNTGTLRFSFSPFVSEKQVDTACRTLQKILKDY